MGPTAMPAADGVVVGPEGLAALVDVLRSRGLTVVGPTVRDGAIVLAELESAGELPYGAQRRLEIARAMCSEPELLCLDEPAAGLNHRESAELEELLLFIREKHATSILLIEHDMSVVMEISDHIVVLDHGVKISDGEPRAVRDDPKVVAAYLGADEDTAIEVMESGT